MDHEGQEVFVRESSLPPIGALQPETRMARPGQLEEIESRGVGSKNKVETKVEKPSQYTRDKNKLFSEIDALQSNSPRLSSNEETPFPSIRRNEVKPITPRSKQKDGVYFEGEEFDPNNTSKLIEKTRGEKLAPIGKDQVEPIKPLETDIGTVRLLAETLDKKAYGNYERSTNKLTNGDFLTVDVLNNTTGDGGEIVEFRGDDGIFIKDKIVARVVRATQHASAPDNISYWDRVRNLGVSDYVKDDGAVNDNSEKKIHANQSYWERVNSMNNKYASSETPINDNRNKPKEYGRAELNNNEEYSGWWILTREHGWIFQTGIPNQKGNTFDERTADPLRTIFSPAQRIDSNTSKNMFAELKRLLGN